MAPAATAPVTAFPAEFWISVSFPLSDLPGPSGQMRAVSACLSKDSGMITHLQCPCKTTTTIPTLCAFGHWETQLLFSSLVIISFYLSAHSSGGPRCFNTVHHRISPRGLPNACKNLQFTAGCCGAVAPVTSQSSPFRHVIWVLLFSNMGDVNEPGNVPQKLPKGKQKHRTAFQENTMRPAERPHSDSLDEHRQQIWWHLHELGLSA